jgi:hypothetical protein
VAREPTGLYPRSPQLVEFAGRLNEEWWYDTNVGRSQVRAYLQKFAKMLKLAGIPRISKRSEKSEITLADLGIG